MDLLRINGTRCRSNDGGVTMKLKTIQTLALIALAGLILIGAATAVFDTLEMIMWTVAWLCCAVASLLTNDSNI